ncbi:MAG: hypothetical protein HFI72_07480 [Peptococcaceae bacterium]|nr:hypothetical protein [Peptococcaceae bacterium]
MEIFKLFGSIFVDSDKAQESISKTDKKAAGLADRFKSGIKTAAKWGAALTGAAVAVGAALLGVDKATKEYRENLAKLNTAFEVNGMSAENAKMAYSGLYKIIGDNDTATEAAQLLANLAQNEEDLANWTEISAGVMGTFGDALPINSLIEAANETAKTGQVTGALADALNWAGISEDAFNARLAQCGSEQERNALITQTLTATYQDAAIAFNENNKEISAAREAQMQLDETMAKLGEAVGNVKNQLMIDFLPAISSVISAFIDFVEGVDGADEALRNAVKNMVGVIMEKLPDFLNFGVEVIASIASGVISNLPYLLKKVPGIVFEIVKAFGALGVELFNCGKQLFMQLWDGLKSIWTNVSNWVSSKVNWLKDKLMFWRSSTKEIEDTTFDNIGSIDGSHASGLAFVPYDGYRAELHRGERIMTAEENNSLYEQIVNGIITAFGGMSGCVGQNINLTVNLDSKQIAEVVFDPLRNVAKQKGVAFG